jgi:DNA helicase IV
MLGPSPSLTVAGDDLQRTGAGEFDGWDDLLRDLGVEGALRRALAVSYRCPIPIAQLAHRVLGPLAAPEPPTAGRPGAPVGIHRFPSAGPQILAVQDAIVDLIEAEPQASIGLLTRTAAVAVRWAEALSHVHEARLVTHGDFSFEPGLDICEVSEAKGLEFDYVLVPDADATTYPGDDDSRRALHVAVTRAMHQLWLTHVGTPSPLIAST